MPRFGTKSLLVAFAVAAVWLSTFSGYALASDVRKSILLLILVTSGVVALYSHGRRQAFWSAFFIVMLLCGGLKSNQPLHRYVPDFAWLQSIEPLPGYSPAADLFGPPATPTSPAPPDSTPPTISDPVLSPYMSVPPVIIPSLPIAGTSMREARTDTYTAAWIIGLSVLAGFVAAYIYDQTPKSAALLR